MAYYPISPAKSQGTYEDVWTGIAASGLTALAWQKGALLKVVTGLLVEYLNADADILGWGFSNSPYSTGTGFATIDTERQEPVGAGVAIAGVRRGFYPLLPGFIWKGSLDTAGSTGTHVAAVADIGATHSLQSVNAAGALTDHNFWIVDFGDAGGLDGAVITRLIDPPGSSYGNSPIGGINSGQGLIEFVVLGSQVSRFV